MYFVECPSVGFVWWVLIVRFQLCRHAMVVSLFLPCICFTLFLLWICPIVDDYLVRWGQPGFVPIKLHIFLLAFNKYFGERIFTIIIFIVQFNVDFIMFQIWPVGHHNLALACFLTCVHYSWNTSLVLVQQCTQCTFTNLALESSIFPRSYGSFSYRSLFRSWDLHSRHIISTG